MSALAAFVLTGCALVRDDSLDDILKAFQLQLPDCKIDAKSYSGTAARSEEQLNLSFRAPKECVDQYIRSHGEKPDNPFRWPFGGGTLNGVKLDPNRPPFPEATVKEMNWKFDPSRQYNCYSHFDTPNGGRFMMVVDLKGDEQTVYMMSTDAPNRHS
ncbi:hypothetical protein ACGFLS_28365 [Streptomyces abikoensis]|uniref:hypothetical protein n=1 Tax=Streptomyces abikoensis TaxID=97398 RepID=UPI0037106B07